MTISKILTTAQARAKAKHLSYEGELTPTEAYEILQIAPGARLVDVRTHAEWDWVGTIPGAVQIEWLNYPDGDLNEHFITELKQAVRQESLVLFICRSGVRSHYAAELATKAGFRDSYNVLEGFEGDKDDKAHRNKKAGWRAAGLPWMQS
jgi:rhodanese-related sulfurtransferase